MLQQKLDLYTARFLGSVRTIGGEWTREHVYLRAVAKIYGRKHLNCAKRIA